MKTLFSNHVASTALLLIVVVCQGHEVVPGLEAADRKPLTADAPSDSLAERIGLLYRASRFSEAAALCEEHLGKAESNRASYEAIKVLNECGSVYRRTSKSREATDLHARALDFARQLDDRQGEASSLARLGLSLKDRGESQRALEAYRESLAIFEDLGQTASAATLYHNTGALLLAIGQPDAALAELQQALAIRRRAGEPGRLGSTLSKIANAHELLGEPVLATNLLHESLRHRRQAGDKLGEATTLDRIGVIEARRGKPERALDPLRKALAIVSTFGDRSGQIHSLANLGGVYLDLGRPRLARQLFEQGLDLLASHDNRNAEAHLSMGLGIAARDLGDFALARVMMERGLAVIEADWERAPVGQLRAGFLGIHQPSFELYIDLLFERHRRQPDIAFVVAAFWATERARARGLLDLIASGPIRPPADLSPTLFASLDDLRRQLTRIELDRHGLSLAPGDRTANRDEVTDEAHPSRLMFQYRELLATLSNRRQRSELRARSEPGIPDLGVDPTSTAGNVALLQSLVGDDTVLLSYFFGSERSFLFTVDERGLRWHELPDRQLLERVTRDLLTSLRHSRNRSQLGQTRIIAEKLGQLLLEPADLEDDGRRLAVIADGWLQYLPFSVLPMPGGKRGEHGSAAPLIAQREVVYVPSASVLVNLRERRQERNGDLRRNVAVIAPGFDRGSTSEASGSLSPLPASTSEATAILSLADTRHSFALLGSEATKRAFTNADFSQIGIVHFATHGLLHPRHPELSALLLSPAEIGSAAEGDLLHLFEVFDLELPIEMVVLSACETALGELLPGEGMVSMSHGFFTAGASRVVVSLWRVDDRATAALMTNFYRGLLEHDLSPAAALREAQNHLRDSTHWSAPYYWAGFVLQGEWL